MNDFIFEESNFISSTEAYLVLDKIQEAELSFKKNAYNIHGKNYEFHNLEEQKDFKEIVQEYERKIRAKVDIYFHSYDVQTFKQDFLSASVLYLKAGDSIPKHTDDQYDMGILRSIGVLLYLNTPLFGGQLGFPLQKRLIAPEAGKLVIFPSVFTHPHQVMPTISEDRYALRFNYGMRAHE